MKLEKLLKNIKTKKVIGNVDIEIENLSCNSQELLNNSMFFCISGTKTDGHKFSVQAEKHGAVAIVCERELKVNATQIIVDNVRQAMAIIASDFYGRKDEKLKIIGVTGTNGKTTTASLIYQILISANKKCALIGTLGVFYGDKKIETSLTTPDPIELHKYFNDMYFNGMEFVVMEVSAHALFYDKVKGINYTAVVFTNFTQDHLDFFGDMENYKKAKLKLFNDYKFKYAVVNSDDNVGVEISNKIDGAISYGIDNPADVFAIRIKENSDKIEFIVNLFDHIDTVKIPLVGRFNVSNALGALTTCTLLGINSKKAVESINNVVNVSGRLEKICDKNFKVYVDYAHTPDGLLKSLVALKKICTGRLICVFGCGGNRDRLKRSKMGKISGENADFTIVTSDNPRYEEPMDIISEIEKGVLSITKKYILIEDRVQAIKYAINFAKPKDIVLIAGKGCENYQEILGSKHIYNDKETVLDILRGNID